MENLGRIGGLSTTGVPWSIASETFHSAREIMLIATRPSKIKL